MPAPHAHWSIHPARARPLAAAFALCAVAAIGTLVSQLAGEWFFGALSSLVLFLSLSRFFLPTRFCIDESGAHVIYPLSRAALLWSDVGSIKWSASRALIARSHSRRDRNSGLAFDFSTLSVEERTKLRTFVESRTSARVWW